jgi:hypothetical protein
MPIARAHITAAATLIGTTAKKGEPHGMATH